MKTAKAAKAMQVVNLVVGLFQLLGAVGGFFAAVYCYAGFGSLPLAILFGLGGAVQMVFGMNGTLDCLFGDDGLLFPVFGRVEE